MNASKIIATTLFTTFLVVTSPARAAEPPKVVVDRTVLATMPAQDQAEVLRIADRLNTLANTDRSGLTKEEKRAMRDELKVLRHEAQTYNAAGGGTVIYISSGLLIIILLLIILL